MVEVYQRFLRRFFVFLELLLRQLFDSGHLQARYFGQSGFKLLAIVGKERADQFIALPLGPEVADLSVLTRIDVDSRQELRRSLGREIAHRLKSYRPYAFCGVRFL